MVNNDVVLSYLHTHLYIMNGSIHMSDSCCEYQEKCYNIVLRHSFFKGNCILVGYNLIDGNMLYMNDETIPYDKYLKYERLYKLENIFEKYLKNVW